MGYDFFHVLDLGFLEYLSFIYHYRSRFAKVHTLGLDYLVFPFVGVGTYQFFDAGLKFFATFLFTVGPVADKNKLSVVTHFFLVEELEGLTEFPAQS